MAAGFATELRTLPRIGKVMKERFGVELSQSSVWRMLQQRAGVCSDRMAALASATRRRSPRGERRGGQR
jgi:hypothetical protein